MILPSPTHRAWKPVRYTSSWCLPAEQDEAPQTARPHRHVEELTSCIPPRGIIKGRPFCAGTLRHGARRALPAGRDSHSRHPAWTQPLDLVANRFPSAPGSHQGTSLHLIGDVLNQKDPVTTAGYAYFDSQNGRRAIARIPTTHVGSLSRSAPVLKCCFTARTNWPEAVVQRRWTVVRRMRRWPPVAHVMI